MKQRYGARVFTCLLGWLLCCLLFVAPSSWAQQAQGTISVVVVDPTGGVVTGADLKLVDQATNDVRTAVTQDAGNYTFVNLSFGTYKLTVTKGGFETQGYNIVVQTNRNTDVHVTLKVGSTTQVVEVEGGAAPLIETTSSATNMTIDTKQIEDLPLNGRNIATFSRLSAGYNGTWNGLPSMAQGNTIDGIVGSTSRWRYQTTESAISTGVTPRLENIAEMTVSTDQIDLNQGWGNSNMQITYVTRRGSNAFHGRLFEDHRNSALNATDWGATKKTKYHLNEFGGSLGGPIFKDKLFFFGSFSMSKQPGGRLVRRDYLTDAAQQGIFTFGGGYTANLFNIVGAYNSANEASLPAARLQQVGNWLNQINSWRGTAGSQYSTNPTDPNMRTWEWLATNPITYYYPTFRIDYNLSQNWRANFAYNQTKYMNVGANADHWPGDGRGADNKSNGKATSLGLEWTVSPTLINQFKFGYLYTASWFGINGETGFWDNPQIAYNYGSNDALTDFYEKPNSRMQPVFSLSDNITWAKGAHTFRFGFSAVRDQNKYWDPPEGFNIITLGLDANDPAQLALTRAAIQAAAGAGAPALTTTEWTRARQLYATLTGRISGITGRHAYDPKTSQYATGVGSSTLNELMMYWGLSFQDSYKMKQNLTVNYGLRWDFISANKDLTGKYHSLSPQDLFGPTAVGDLFNPGSSSLSGTNDPIWSTRETPYKAWRVTPQPTLGVAWTPRSSGNFIEKVLGGEQTVVRAGYSLRRFTEPQQFVWDIGSSYGIGFYQSFWANPTTSPGAAGTFAPGSLNLASALPTLAVSPATFDRDLHMNELTWGGSFAAGAIKDNIRQPYTQSWNLGIQRELGPSRAIEIRYNGNRTLRQWLAQNINEVNVFENGFLQEFQHAQANLQLNGGASFAKPSSGGYALPIMTAAGVSFTDPNFISNLQNGAVGSFASSLASDRTYFCNLVGSTAFSPCGGGFAGHGYPVNFWQANPYANGSWMAASYMNDNGYSNYNALQLEFRQRQWHGTTVTANYTWSKTLGVTPDTEWTGSVGLASAFTVRDTRSSYMPSSTDRNHIIHVNATYDLPFGKGKQFLNQGGIVDKVLGGWTTSTIITFQTGTPFRVFGSYNTFNDINDGGVVLNGITADDFKKHTGRYTASDGTPYFLDPTWVKQIIDNGNIVSNTTPGTYSKLFLHGPNQTFVDLGISKSASITERVKFKFQTELINAFNHPVFANDVWWYWGGTYLDSGSFGKASQLNNAGSALSVSRRIELRANIEF